MESIPSKADRRTALHLHMRRRTYRDNQGVMEAGADPNSEDRWSGVPLKCNIEGAQRMRSFY